MEDLLSIESVVGIYAVSTLLLVTVSVLAWRRRRVPGATPLAWLTLATAYWAGWSIFELFATSPAALLRISQLHYPGTIASAPLYLLTACAIARVDPTTIRRALPAIWAIPLITLLLVWTSDWHTLIWTDISLVDGWAIYQYGPAFWVFIGGHYSMMAASLVVLVRAATRVEAYLRRTLLFVITALLAPWALNLAYITKAFPTPGIDWTILGLSISGMGIGWAILKRGLVDLVPAAQTRLLENVRDGVIVTDTAGFPVLVNGAAREMLDLPEHVDRAVLDALWPRIGLEARESAIERTRREVVWATGQGTRWLDVRSDVVADEWGHDAARLVLLHDVTARKTHEEEREKLIAELQTALAEIRTLSGLLPICAGCKRIRDDGGYWNQIETYLSRHADVRFSHGLCPACVERYEAEAEAEAEDDALPAPHRDDPTAPAQGDPPV